LQVDYNQSLDVLSDDYEEDITIVTGNDPKDNTDGNLPDHILAPRIIR